jgi:hypothetical protein
VVGVVVNGRGRGRGREKRITTLQIEERWVVLFYFSGVDPTRDVTSLLGVCTQPTHEMI